MKVKYKDGTEETFNANVWMSSVDESNYPEGTIILIKRTYDSDDEYEEDDDEEIVLLNIDEIRCINLK